MDKGARRRSPTCQQHMRNSKNVVKKCGRFDITGGGWHTENI